MFQSALAYGCQEEVGERVEVSCCFGKRLCILLFSEHQLPTVIQASMEYPTMPIEILKLVRRQIYILENYYSIASPPPHRKSISEFQALMNWVDSLTQLQFKSQHKNVKHNNYLFTVCMCSQMNMSIRRLLLCIPSFRKI